MLNQQIYRQKTHKFNGKNIVNYRFDIYWNKKLGAKCVHRIITEKHEFVIFFAFHCLLHKLHLSKQYHITILKAHEVRDSWGEKKMANIIGNSSIYDILSLEPDSKSNAHGSSAALSIRFIKANYFQHNIEFHRLLGDDVTQDAQNYFLMSGNDLRWSENSPKKKLCDWTKKIFSQKTEKSC